MRDFQGIVFYMNTNILGDFQICFSAPLTQVQLAFKIFFLYSIFKKGKSVQLFMDQINRHPDSKSRKSKSRKTILPMLGFHKELPYMLFVLRCSSLCIADFATKLIHIAIWNVSGGHLVYEMWEYPKSIKENLPLIESNIKTWFDGRKIFYFDI